ncbi:MAG: 50S ribosomal protein L4 [Gemmatimonadetes bacterium]|nr:50S ribosomal protein L4 [Gemmatimonadota bacterium]MDP7632686.1 50S ribosomal protein L4 [Candidatus Latescibacterota bacterium]HCV24048.1 50S ribosomal protein L4 [Candidatus Latescibacterota bacterium]|tara:strand:+ start:42 stop:671 length:630 start_codon:yes stop_codon:yes gene_type:complete
MASVDILSAAGQKSGSVDLPAQLFEAEVSEQAIHRAVVVYEANQRQGNASVKGRSEVAYSKRKHHRQKGTGSARRGTVGSPILRGGGSAFSLPKPRSYSSRLTRSVRKRAISSALSLKASEGKVLVVDDVQLSEPSTKTFASLLNACGASGKVLFVQADANPAVVKSGRNIAGVTMSTAGTVGTYEIIAHDILVLTSASVEALSKVHGG